MILNQLYPNGSSWYTGRTYQQYQDFLAQTAGAYGYDGYSPDAYYMGWISADNLDVAMRHSEVEVDDTVYKFTDDTNSENFPVGFVVNPQPSYNFMENGECIKNQDDTYSTRYSNLAFVNQWYPEFSGQYQSCNAYFVVKISDAGGNYVASTTASNVQNTNLNLSTPRDTYKFLYLNIPVTVNLGNTYGSFTFNSEELDEDGTVYKETSTGYFARLFFISYVIGNYTYVYHQNSASSIQQFKTFATISYANGNYSRCFTGNLWNYGAIYMRNYQNNGSWMHDNTGNGYGGWRPGMDGTIDISLLNSLHPYMWDGNVLAEWRQYSGNLFEVDFKCICTRQDFKRAFSMQFRLDFNTYTMSYVNGVTYATSVSTQNEFLAVLKTGDIEDPMYKAGLRPWQYENFQEDEFTEEDVPPYEPPEPGGDDPGSDEPVETPTITGDNQELQIDRTLPAPTDFITLYVITPPILSRFGRTLWTSLADYDPQDPTSVEIYKNFFAILNEQVTGTLDISSVLNYVISVRQYPFDVSDLSTVSAAGNTITFGTGKLPIDCGSAAVVCTMSSTIGILDCGEVTIADYKDFKLYNDFRDYHNTTVTAFLPYCGTVELNPMETIHNTIHCYYAIDFYTGECTAYLTVTDSEGHEIIAGIKNGIIGVLLPITATNSGQVSGRHTVDNAMDSSLVTGFFGNAFGAVANIATGNVGGAANNIVGIANQQVVTRQMLQGEREGRSAVMSPSLSGGTGAAAFYQPAGASILVRRGTYARDKIKNYPQTCGYPATTSGTLSTFKGYTECYNVDVSGINCTDEEKSAIKALLETGVYL